MKKKLPIKKKLLVCYTYCISLLLMCAIILIGRSIMTKAEQESGTNLVSETREIKYIPTNYSTALNMYPVSILNANSQNQKIEPIPPMTDTSDTDVTENETIIAATTTDSTEETTENDVITEESTTENTTEETTTETVEEPVTTCVADYNPSDFIWMGVINWGGSKWTYYSERILPGEGLNIPGRHTDEDGFVCDEDGYIVLAADRSYIPQYTIIDTPFGRQGKLYDCGCAYGVIDVYTNW